MSCILSITPELITDPCNGNQISTACTIQESAINYLSLPPNTPLDQVLNSYLLSLVDARTRINVLEAENTITEAPINGLQYGRQWGEWTEIASGDPTFIEVTKSELDILITNNQLTVGALYKITGVHPTLYNDGTNSGTTIYLQALTTNTLAKEGHGEFWNPKYDKEVSGFGIFQDYNTFDFNPVTLIGDFEYSENVTTNNGATGIIIGHIEAGYFRSTGGDWSTAVSVTGNTSGATLVISNINLVSHLIGDTVIWGGYHWINTTGISGNSIDCLTLDANWSKKLYTTFDYNKVYDIIKYDYDYDIIIHRDNNNGYVVDTCRLNMKLWADRDYIGTPINISQFGNTYEKINKKEVGIGYIKIHDAYNENINFRGAYQLYLEFKPGSEQKDIIFGEGSYQADITFEHTAFQSHIVFGNYSNQVTILLGKNSFQTLITFGIDCFQYKIELNQDAHQQLMRFGQNSYQESLIFEQSAFQQHSILKPNSKQVYLLFESAAYQSQITLGENVIQKNIVFEQNSIHTFISLPNNVIMQLIHFEQGVNINSVDYSLATLIFAPYPKMIYFRPDGTPKIRYYDNTDTLVIANITD